MSKLHDISVVRIAYRGGEWDGWRVGSGVGWAVAKKPQLGHLWSSHDTNRCLHNGPCHIIRPQWHPVSSGSNFRSLRPNWHPPLVPSFQSWLWRASKMPSRKEDQLIYNIWYSISVNCVNESEFNFGRNYVGFCLDSQKIRLWCWWLVWKSFCVYNERLAHSCKYQVGCDIIHTLITFVQLIAHSYRIVPAYLLGNDLSKGFFQRISLTSYPLKQHITHPHTISSVIFLFLW